MKRDVGMVCQKSTQTRKDKSDGKYSKPLPYMFALLWKDVWMDEALYIYHHFHPSFTPYLVPFWQLCKPQSLYVHVGLVNILRSAYSAHKAHKNKSSPKYSITEVIPHWLCPDESKFSVSHILTTIYSGKPKWISPSEEIFVAFMLAFSEFCTVQVLEEQKNLTALRKRIWEYLYL